MADVILDLCLKRRRSEIGLDEFCERLRRLLVNPDEVENIAIDVESLHSNQVDHVVVDHGSGAYGYEFRAADSDSGDWSLSKKWFPTFNQACFAAGQWLGVCFDNDWPVMVRVVPVGDKGDPA